MTFGPPDPLKKHVCSNSGFYCTLISVFLVLETMYRQLKNLYINKEIGSKNSLIKIKVNPNAKHRNHLLSKVASAKMHNIKASIFARSECPP